MAILYISQFSLFVITSKYISTRSFKKIGGVGFSKVYPILPTNNIVSSIKFRIFIYHIETCKSVCSLNHNAGGQSQFNFCDQHICMFTQMGVSNPSKRCSSSYALHKFIRHLILSVNV